MASAQSPDYTCLLSNNSDSSYCIAELAMMNVIRYRRPLRTTKPLRYRIPFSPLLLLVVNRWLWINQTPHNEHNTSADSSGQYSVEPAYTSLLWSPPTRYTESRMCCCSYWLRLLYRHVKLSDINGAFRFTEPTQSHHTHPHSFRLMEI